MTNPNPSCNYEKLCPEGEENNCPLDYEECPYYFWYQKISDLDLKMQENNRRLSLLEEEIEKIKEKF